jgi:hypothetical protein
MDMSEPRVVIKDIVMAMKRSYLKHQKYKLHFRLSRALSQVGSGRATMQSEKSREMWEKKVKETEALPTQEVTTEALSEEEEAVSRIRVKGWTPDLRTQESDPEPGERGVSSRSTEGQEQPRRKMKSKKQFKQKKNSYNFIKAEAL